MVTALHVLSHFAAELLGNMFISAAIWQFVFNVPQVSVDYQKSVLKWTVTIIVSHCIFSRLFFFILHVFGFTVFLINFNFSSYFQMKAGDTLTLAESLLFISE